MYHRDFQIKPCLSKGQAHPVMSLTAATTRTVIHQWPCHHAMFSLQLLTRLRSTCSLVVIWLCVHMWVYCQQCPHIPRLQRHVCMPSGCSNYNNVMFQSQRHKTLTHSGNLQSKQTVNIDSEKAHTHTHTCMHTHILFMTVILTLQC